MSAHLITVEWYSHKVTPAHAPVSVVIAYPSDELGPAFLAGGTYQWNGEGFFGEEDDEPPRQEAFWWMYERDLCNPLGGFQP